MTRTRGRPATRRNPRCDQPAGGWLTAVWTHLRTAPVPFGDLAWDHSRRMLAARGDDPATEAEIAQAAAALLDRAEQGPTDTRLSTKDRRIVGRTRATTEPTW